jgi:hypothetical protein
MQFSVLLLTLRLSKASQFSISQKQSMFLLFCFLLVYGHVVVLDYIRTSVTSRSLKLLDLALLPSLDITIRTQEYHLCSVSHRNL